MRTTLDIEDDVLIVAKDIARQRRSSIGRVISELVRKGLRRESDIDTEEDGYPVFPRKGKGQVVTLELVNRLRDEEP